jgi:hypothetical protein
MIAGDIYGTHLTRRPEGVQPEEPSKLRAVGEQAKEKGADYMASHPLVTVVVAITLGVTLGWLIKRR